MYKSDTIAAISTPPGEGAIGIIRLSGPDAGEIVSGIFKPVNPKSWNQATSYTLHLGTLSFRSQELDQVIVSVMKAPHTYTGEDVIEINCHGGWLILNRILDTVIGLGARLAEPGEFTKRAFLNGKMQLSQAEAVVDLIRAKTEQAAQIAIRQLKPSGVKKIMDIRDTIVDCLCHIEANLDFSDQHLDTKPASIISDNLGNVRKLIENTIDSAKKARIFRNGIHITIVGKTNAGKSSLANLLTDNKKIIVTSVPGTTRDVIEEVINICGIPVVIADTAGIRIHSGKVEELGQKKTKEKVKTTDVVLAVFDLARKFGPDDKKTIRYIKKKKGIIVFNKRDLKQRLETPDITEKLPGWPVVEISAKKQRDTEKVKQTIYKFLMEDRDFDIESVFISNSRQINILESALTSLNSASNALKEGIPEDIVSIELNEALKAIDRLTGREADDAVLDRVFSKFCVGK